jgi:cell fate (sporulation/competence/biofilm development) regulator YlbF (YheA/YmcA/DUF963 family)
VTERERLDSEVEEAKQAVADAGTMTDLFKAEMRLRAAQADLDTVTMWPLEGEE